MNLEKNLRAIAVLLDQIVQDYGVDMVSDWVEEKPATVYKMMNENELRYHMKAGHLRSLSFHLAEKNDLRAIKINVPHTCTVSRFMEDISANGTLKEENRDAYRILARLNETHLEEDPEEYQRACDELDELANRYRSEGRML